MDLLPLVSFVIPVRNNAAGLRLCLASVRALDYPANRIELIVADNGSTDASPAVAREAGASVLSLPQRRPSEMRNEAAAAAAGDIVAFVDSDHQIDRAWLRSAVETIQTHDAAAVGAPYTAPPGGTWVQRHYDRLRRRSTGIVPTDWLASGNMAIRREAFHAIGGFDVSLHTCEDVDFCQRLRASGASILSDPRMHSTHFFQHIGILSLEFHVDKLSRPLL